MNMITKITAAIVALASTAACALPSYAAPGWFNNGYGYNNSNPGFFGGISNWFNNGFGNNGYQNYPGYGFGNGNGYGYGYGYGNNRGRLANVDRYQDRLNNVIQRGVSNGRITAKEAERLAKQQNRINELEARLRASGNRLSFNERQRLTNELNRLHNRVRQEITDRQGRFW